MISVFFKVGGLLKITQNFIFHSSEVGKPRVNEEASGEDLLAVSSCGRKQKEKKTLGLHVTEE